MVRKIIQSFHLIISAIILLSSVYSTAEVFFYDGFDDPELGDRPDRNKWTVFHSGDSGNNIVTIQDDALSAGGNSAKIEINEGGNLNAGIRSKTVQPRKSFWVDVQICIDHNTAEYGAIIDLVKGNEVSISLRLKPQKNSSKYDAIIVRRDETGKLKENIIAKHILCPIGQWRRWIVGLNITNSETGAGICTVYVDDQAVLKDIPFLPLDKNATSVDTVQISAQGTGSTHLEDIKLWDVDPVTYAATETVLTKTPYFEPKDYSYISYRFGVRPDGQMVIELGKSKYFVNSKFSNTKGGMLLLGSAGLNTGDQLWESAVVDKKTELSYCVTAENRSYRLQREIQLFPNRIQVKDTLTNLTNELMGVRFANEIYVENDTGSTIAGIFKAPNTLNNPERPFVHTAQYNTSVGMIARDDVYRNQSVCYGVKLDKNKRCFGIKDDHLGLSPASSYTIKWELYPQNSSDYYDFINTVRLAWKTLDATIPWLCGFVYPHRVWSSNGKRLDQMSVDEMRDWLHTNKVGVICFTVMSDEDPRPAYPIEAFGREYLDNAELSKAYWRPIIKRLRKAKPDIKILPYLHYGHNKKEDALKDSRVLLEGGKHKDFTNYLGIKRHYYYATENNSFGKLIRQVFRTMLDEFGQDGIYFDEFSFGNRSVYMYDVPDWDGYSVLIDPNTNRIIKKLTNMALITQPIRNEFMGSLKNKTVFYNWLPTSEIDTERHLPGFIEHFNKTNYTRAHLTAPVATGGANAKTNADVMNEVYKFLQHGLLYFHIGNGLYAETNESILGRIYPITPMEIHQGYIIGKRKIITSRSGGFGFGDKCSINVWVYDRVGSLKEHKEEIVEQEGKRYCILTLSPGEIAVIEKKP